MENSTETIVLIARQKVWEQSIPTGEYTQSTIDTALADVGFIHCSFPSQTMDIVNRKCIDQDTFLLLLVDTSKVKSPIKFEGALSGRPGVFPHIYGPLNVDAVYAVLPLAKNAENKFTTPDQLQALVEIQK